MKAKWQESVRSDQARVSHGHPRQRHLSLEAHADHPQRVGVKQYQVNAGNDLHTGKLERGRCQGEAHSGRKRLSQALRNHG